MTLRIGINLHNKARAGQERSAAEKSYLPEFLQELNPSAIVVMDNLPFAEAMHARLPDTIVIYRQFNEAEGHLWKVITPEQYLINQKGISKPGIPLYCINEPNSKADIPELSDRVKWLVRVMELYAVNGLTLVVDNLGPGHPDFSNFSDDAKWAVIKPLFDAFKRYPMMYWGLHPYWSNRGLRPEDGQSAIHRDIEKLLRTRGYNMPKVIFTEMGRDNYGGSKTNGWRSTGISEEAYAAEIITARNTLWTESYIRGACVYCYGSVTDRWTPFDIESAKVIHTALIAANHNVDTPPPDAIVPSDLGNVIATRIIGDNWFMRSEPSANAAQIGKLLEGEEIKLYPATAIPADGQSYKVVERIIAVAGEARIAWSAYPTPTNAPPVSSDEKLNTIARLIVIRAKIHAMASLMEDVVRDIHQMELDIAASEAAKAAEIAAAA